MKTKPKMVVVWANDDILSSSIQYILAPKEDWKVVNISNKEDLDALILAVEYTQLNIIIIHQRGDDSLSNFPLQLLQDHPAIKVIMICLEDNMMDVYSIQKKWVHQASDLIAVIENNSVPHEV